MESLLLGKHLSPIGVRADWDFIAEDPSVQPILGLGVAKTDE